MLTCPPTPFKIYNMKHIALAVLTGVLLSACSTVKQVQTDFKTFCSTVKQCNSPKHTWPKEGWHSNCNLCIPTTKCRWSKCPNKEL